MTSRATPAKAADGEGASDIARPEKRILMDGKEEARLLIPRYLKASREKAYPTLAGEFRRVVKAMQQHKTLDGPGEAFPSPVEPRISRKPRCTRVPADRRIVIGESGRTHKEMAGRICDNYTGAPHPSTVALQNECIGRSSTPNWNCHLNNSSCVKAICGTRRWQCIVLYSATMVL